MEELESYSKDDDTPDAKKTSLRPYVEHFGNFVKRLLAKAPKRPGWSYSSLFCAWRKNRSIVRQSRVYQRISFDIPFQAKSTWTSEDNIGGANGSVSCIHANTEMYAVINFIKYDFISWSGRNFSQYRRSCH